MNRMFITGSKAATVLLIASLVPEIAVGKERVSGQYATSKQPYWNVGTLDKQLSGACQRGGDVSRNGPDQGSRGSEFGRMYRIS